MSLGPESRCPAYQWQRMASGASSYTNLSDGGDYGGSQTQMLVVERHLVDDDRGQVPVRGDERRRVRR
jgi:hypothetical protein